MDGTSSAVDSWHLEEAPVGPSPRTPFSKVLRRRGYDDVTAAHSPTLCTLARSGAHVAGSWRPALTELVSKYTDPLLRCRRLAILVALSPASGSAYSS